ncbi:hypothetical protein [Corynebacterium macginleyi]|uniref:hypothetical protein n=1 Tax=Corynebacterium macginleyi TaxID=38290 RepID=UPI000EFA122A|nr:hypothetical protein [Corynebacterium macginleyi]QRP20945.1 hypothetical protein I6J25_09690 [Corynebacterium macginleyi]RMB65516.1 hypothetical protein D9V82_08315 [Corynebacterium macginleyi]
MTTWLVALTSIVFINVLGTFALSIAVNQRLKRLEKEAARGYYRDRELQKSINSINKTVKLEAGWGIDATSLRSLEAHLQRNDND